MTLTGGAVPNSAATAALTAGSYSYIAVYSGDSNYTGSTRRRRAADDQPGTRAVSTAIDDAGGGTVTGVLGESVNDTATVTGTPGFTPTGTVTYDFYNTATPTLGTTTPSTTRR